MANAQGNAIKGCAELSLSCCCSVQVHLRCSSCSLCAETLGGNCLTTVIGTLRQGEWDRSLVTLKHLLSAQRVGPRLTR